MNTSYTFAELAAQDDAVAVAGRKAVSLVELLKIGVPVPDGAVLTTVAFKQFAAFNRLESQVSEVLLRLRTPDAGGVADAIAALKQAMHEARMPQGIASAIAAIADGAPQAAWAVRSSCTQEDMAGASFAGIYESVLNVRGEAALHAAVKQCWASMFSDMAERYCARNRIDLGQGGMAVILQRMVNSDASGVAFSVNPQSGHDTEMVIEACFGLGEALVSGHITPDQYRYDWYRDQETGRQVNHKGLRILAQPDGSNLTEMLDEQAATRAVLTDAQVATLARECLRIQKAYGFPVDIEWALEGGKFYFVQARPVTAIHYGALQMEWSNADFKDGGVSSSVCSAFMWSLYDAVWEAICPNYTSSIRVHPDFKVDAWGRMFFSRPYWNLTAIKAGVKSLPGFVEREFDEGVGVKVTYEGNGHVTPLSLKILARGVSVLARLKWILWRSKSRLPGFKREQAARLAELPRVLAALSEQALPAFYIRFVNEEFFRSEYSYFHHIFSTNNAMTLFRDGFKKLKSRYTVLDLISGLAGLSHLHLNVDLWDVAQELRADPATAAYWAETPTPALIAAWRAGSQEHGMARAAAVVERHKYRSTRELDITVERFGENPEFLFDNIKQCLALGAGSNPHDGVRDQADRHEKTLRDFAASLPVHKRGGMIKRIEELRFYLWWREELRDLSTAYYHWVRQLTLRVGQRFVREGIIDSVEDIFHLPKDDINAVLSDKMDGATARVRCQKNKDYYLSFRKFSPPDEIGARFLQDEPASAGAASATRFHGIPCSQGMVEGRVKIIADIHDAERLEKGDILITRFTDPGWTAKFPLLAAVATETGGLLSHAAVISREYGIPAVLAVKNLTALLVDGQLVRIDGGRGLVEVIEVPHE
ncbi:hypothetical protein HF313_17605 [Massilia atriviolacea]|uniref:Phosphoenolpyruvate synthase n=1 Tax=Massilia atriviolacea TaxID=2495579 RepID=A0A430HTV3_9BURK|nr:PEP/pyruvate-binding domain-containing protein [Massilia atriviolacea]RSZ60895.1 hypothetical protein EJB06_01795 [Massilia atriviolacea]